MVIEMSLQFSQLNGDWKVTEWRLSVFKDRWRFVLHRPTFSQYIKIIFYNLYFTLFWKLECLIAIKPFARWKKTLLVSGGFQYVFISPFVENAPKLLIISFRIINTIIWYYSKWCSSLFLQWMLNLAIDTCLINHSFQHDFSGTQHYSWFSIYLWHNPY